jgi:hypothetical protein
MIFIVASPALQAVFICVSFPHVEAYDYENQALRDFIVADNHNHINH